MSKPQDPRILGGCVYYSQNREDLVLQAFFPGEKDGFYVDVGAFHPDIDSVTKLFYLHGWHGINIEPQVEMYRLFEKRRKRDINLNVGVSDKSSELKLRIYKSGGLSTFSEAMQHDYAAEPDDDTKTYTEAKVAVVPLREVFAEQKVGKISFMKVDVEGLEYEVLASNDWRVYRPEVLCIEANHIIEKDWRPLLVDAKYKCVFNDGLNDYYVNTHTDRERKFDFVKEVVHDRGGGVRADHYQMLLDWFTYGTDKAHHVEELAAEAVRLTERRDAEWNNPKIVAKRLAYLTKQRIRGSGKKGN